MFRNIISVAMLAIGIIGATTSLTALTATPAAAETVSVNCKGLTRSVCNAAVAALKRAPYRDAVRPAKEPMACVRTVSYGQTPIEWVDRSHLSKSGWRDGRLIASTGVVHTETFVLDQTWTVTESCIPRRLLEGVSKITLCTGLYARGFHWNLSAAEVRRIKRTGHLTSYVPFLRHADRDHHSVARVRAAYRARYGI